MPWWFDELTRSMAEHSGQKPEFVLQQKEELEIFKKCSVFVCGQGACEITHVQQLSYRVHIFFVSVAPSIMIRGKTLMKCE
jgi:hypothetical protein